MEGQVPEVDTGMMERIKDESEEILVEVFPAGVPEWPSDIRKLCFMLAERYKWCKKTNIGPDSIHWKVWIGRMYNEARPKHMNDKGFKYFDGMRLVLTQLLKYHAASLPYTAKKKKAGNHYKKLKAALLEVTK